MARIREIRVGNGIREVVIPAEALEWQFVRSGGPGGQNVNRTSSKAMLRFVVAGSPHLPEDVRQRVLVQQRSRLTADGALVIASQVHRDQPRNAADCAEKLSAILQKALAPPKRRKRTRTPRSAIAARLDAKRRRSHTKEGRRRPDG
jgi:ribosome-associated protein